MIHQRIRGFAIAVLAGFALSTCPQRAQNLSSGNAEAPKLLANLVVSEAGRIDLRRANETGRTEILISYRELRGVEPEIAQGSRFTVTYVWDQPALSFVPSNVVRGDAAFQRGSGGIFPDERRLQVETSPRVWDFTLQAKPRNWILQLTAPEDSGEPLPVPLESLILLDKESGQTVTLASDVQNVYYVGARALDIDNDGSEEALISVAFYKNRALYILGRGGTRWHQMEFPNFTSLSEAQEFINKYHGTKERN